MRIQFGKQKDSAVFRLEPLASTIPLSGFTCPIEEYNEYLYNDADIEHDTNVTAFYTKNGFIPNVEMNNKRNKT
jgi:hypothetical protein